MSPSPCVQDEQIYITDPRALHHILVKDQHIFEEPAHLISFVQLVTVHMKIITL